MDIYRLVLLSTCSHVPVSILYALMSHERIPCFHSHCYMVIVEFCQSQIDNTSLYGSFWFDRLRGMYINLHVCSEFKRYYLMPWESFCTLHVSSMWIFLWNVPKWRETRQTFCPILNIPPFSSDCPKFPNLHLITLQEYF